MDKNQLRKRLSEEIRKIPESELERALNLLYAFRLGLSEGRRDDKVETDSGIMRFAGVWRNAPELDGLEDELAGRRRAAFKTRRTDETGAD